MEQFISVKTMIQRFADWLVYGVFGMSAETHFGSAVNFFFYDSVKILILLFLISMVMGIVNAYFPIDKLRHYLTTRKLYGFQYLFASDRKSTRLNSSHPSSSRMPSSA